MNHRWITFRFIMVGLIVAIVLVGMLSVDQAAAVSNQPEQTVLFSDDFSGDLSQWSVISGDWYIDQGELVGHGIEINNTWIYGGDSSWINYTFKAKVIFIDSNPKIVLRSTGNSQNEYYIDLSQQGEGNNGFYSVSKIKDGNYKILGGGESRVPISNPCRIEVQVSNNQLILYVNDQFVDDIVDPDPILIGRIGLSVWPDYSARFDDISVTTLPPIMIDPPEQQAFARAGNTMMYQLELENHTGIMESFNLEVLPGNIWTTSLSANQVGPIEDGEIITFTTQVDIPSTSHPGDFDFATIQATSVTSPTIYTNTAKLTTGVADFGYVISGGSLVLIDTFSHTVTDTIDLGSFGCFGPSHAKLNPDGSRLFITCPSSSNILIFDTASNSYITTINAPNGSWDITFIRDGTYALLATSNYSVDILNTSTYVFDYSIPTVLRPSSITIHPSKSIAYISESDISAGYFEVLDTSNFTIIRSIYFDSGLTDAVVSPDGRWVYISLEHQGEGPAISVIDTSTYELINPIESIYFRGLEITEDGSKLYAAGFYSNAVFIYNARTNTFIRNIDLDGGPIEFEPNCYNNELYVATSTSDLPVIDTLTDQVIAHIPMPSWINSIAICPDYFGDIYSRKTVQPSNPSPGALVNYSISMENIGADDIDSIVITDTVPLSLTYKEGSLDATSGSWSFQDGLITWTGSVPTSNFVDINFSAIVPLTMPFSTTVNNTAFINTPIGDFNRSVGFEIGLYQIFLPCASRACLPSYTDNFSNPSSGWPIESGDGYWMGYQNGEYYIAVNEGWMAWAVQDFGVSDFQIEVDARPSVSLYGGVALLFSATDDGFYLFEINDGWFSLWRNDSYNWNWTPLIDWQYSSAIHPRFQANRMQVVRIGSNIKVYANGHLLGSVNDGTYRGTWSGLVSEAWSGYFDGRFDNFALYTGGCIGTLDAPVMIDRASSYDAIYLRPGGSHTRP